MPAPKEHRKEPKVKTSISLTRSQRDALVALGLARGLAMTTDLRTIVQAHLVEQGATATGTELPKNVIEAIAADVARIMRSKTDVNTDAGTDGEVSS